MPTSKQKVNADPTQLHQVLWNLLQNAQTHARPVNELIIEVDGGFSTEGKYAWIDVVDNGRGIAPDLSDQLFEPFYSTAKNGTGLGLFLAKELCEGNGGSLEYLFSVGPGSRFRIKLPVQNE